jgi:hypothetical protein
MAEFKRILIKDVFQPILTRFLSLAQRVLTLKDKKRAFLIFCKIKKNSLKKLFYCVKNPEKYPFFKNRRNCVGLK